MAEFRMPSLGADMTEGTVLEWLVEPGDTVHRGDVVAVVDTDKADIDVESFEDGVVEELLVPVASGSPWARRSPRCAPLGAAAPPPVLAASAGDERLRVSPVARRMAEQLGVDLDDAQRHGPARRHRQGRRRARRRRDCATPRRRPPRRHRRSRTAAPRSAARSPR